MYCVVCTTVGLGAYGIELLRAVERELRLHRARQTEAASDRLDRLAKGEFVVRRRATSDDLHNDDYDMMSYGEPRHH